MTQPTTHNRQPKIIGFLQQIQSKISGSYLRLLDVGVLFPFRLKCLWQHVKVGLSFSYKIYIPGGWQATRWQLILYWLAELWLHLLSLLGIGEWYETFMDWLKFNSRKLTAREIKIAKSVFGDAIDYRKIRMDEKAFFGPLSLHFAYVSFNTINSWGKLSDAVLIHELVHIWQYRQMGICYMSRALMAQHSQMGYNYGGINALCEYKIKLKNLFDFNLEQQADIVADFYRIKNGFHPEWGSGTQEDLPIYVYFIESLYSSRQSSTV